MHEYICVDVLKNRLIRLDQCLTRTPWSTERVNEYFARNPNLNLENRSPPLPRQPRLEQLAPSRFRYAAGVANFAWSSEIRRSSDILQFGGRVRCRRNPARRTAPIRSAIAAMCRRAFRLDAKAERERWRRRAARRSCLWSHRGPLSGPDDRRGCLNRLRSCACLRLSQAASGDTIDVAASSSASDDSLGVSA
jgi:hypothetical protein